MKLEIKHLAPYLPYGLNVWLDSPNASGGQGYMMELETINLESAIQRQAKPLLRPLSDLTKEIEHNGEKFMPYSILMADKTGSVWDIEDLPYSDFVKLFEWHFDVFSLIENGLALDYNDVIK